MNSLNFEQGEIIIAPIPFSNLVQVKLRPALVISTKKYNSKSEDIIVLKITSKGKDYPFDINLKNNSLTTGELTSDSVIQADFPVVIEKQSIVKSIAKVDSKKIKEIKQKICELYEL